MTLDEFNHKIKSNRWHWYFYIFCRISLAFGFFTAGMVKIFGERFASGLSELHPMGAYLEALFHTGYYYTFIGIAQVLAAVLLLIPRTVVLGALLYLPIITNIFILSYAVRFEGSYFTSPLMVMANIYILFWHYDKLKYLLPFSQKSNSDNKSTYKKRSNKFPFWFFGGVILFSVGVILYARYGNEVMPRNSYNDCTSQFEDRKNNKNGLVFCRCIHEEGNDLNTCLDQYNQNTE